MSLQELIDCFDISRISKSGAVFDVDKLRWMNGQHIRGLDKTALYEKVAPFMTESLQERLSSVSEALKEEMVYSIRDNLELLIEINQYLEVYVQTEDSFEEKVAAIDFSDSDITVIQWILDQLGTTTDWSKDSVSALIDRCLEETGLGKGKVFKPIRLASSGIKSGPFLIDYLYIIGKELLATRFQSVLEQKKSG